MKAIILAGGYGTRLGEITKEKAKQLLKVGDKFLIDYVVEKVLALPEVSDVFIVTNAKFYVDFYEWFHGKQLDKVKVLNDGTWTKEERLGSVGDLQFVIDKETIDDDLLVVGGDNLFEDNLDTFLEFFKRKGSAIMVHDVQSLETAKQLGVVEVGEGDKIISFVEKPEHPASTLASTLIYGIRKEHLPLIKEAIAAGFHDRAGDFIKFLSEREPMFALPLSGRWFDIGTVEQLELANTVYGERNNEH